jgi:4-amino-4-deoxychorismate lyase
VLIDGKPGQTISAADRGLHYGDGLFETIAVHDGRPLLWARHISRMQGGCARLGIPCPDGKVLAAEADQLCSGAGLAVLKIIVTRGAGGRGYAPPGEPRPMRVLALHEWPGHPESAWRDGVDAPVCRTRLAPQPALAGIKHLNRLEQVLARQELSASGALEGIMLDVDGFAIEGTMSNLFAVRGDELLTPDLGRCGVEGVVRAEILERGAAAWSLRPVVRPCALEDFLSADEAFLTNSIIGVWPLSSIGGTRLRRGARAAAIARTLHAEGLIALP